jgi:hypothetical protein
MNEIKKFKNCIVNEHINNMNIIQIKKPYEFDKNHMRTKNDILLNIICYHKPKKGQNSLIINKKINLNIIKENKINNNINHIGEKMVVDEIENNKEKCDKIINEELNNKKGDINYELINNNNKECNKEYNKENKELVFISKEIQNKDINKKKNYNEKNEIDIRDGLEINPTEIKRTKNNTKNIFIRYENKMEVLCDKNIAFTEKAKKNLMKIMLPIKLKTIFKEYSKRVIYMLLIKKLKEIKSNVM